MGNAAVRFGFGRNWMNYVRHAVDEERILKARESLLAYIPSSQYTGKTFLDVGSGSGIFSLAAARLNCRKIVSFDVDPLSVEATRTVQERFGETIAGNIEWEIFVGDILSGPLINRYKSQGDIVYSWGVLHHTGRMWDAIKNAARLVKPGGHLILAIYNEAPFSPLWLRVKRTFNTSWPPIRWGILGMALLIFSWENLTALLRSFWRGRRYSTSRGMAYFYDLMDWIGGYPYEYASFDAVRQYVESLGLEFKCGPTQMPTLPLRAHRRERSLLFKMACPYSYLTAYTGNNEFVFRKPGEGRMRFSRRTSKGP